MAGRILRPLQALDWVTPLRRVKHRDHWRVCVILALCTALTYPVWEILFPDTLWFCKLWGAGATGGMVGSVVGFAWQLADPARRGRSSGRLLALSLVVGLGVLAPTAVFFIGPTLQSEQEELARIRTLSAAEVAAVCFHVPGQGDVKLSDRASIISFVNQCRRANLFYVGHERFTDESRLTVHFVDGTVWTYNAGIPERHHADMVLSFPSYIGHSHVWVPDAARWVTNSHE